MIWQFLLNGLVASALYALVAVGFALIYSTTGVFHLAHGAIFSVAAYSFYYTSVVQGWPWPLAIILALGMAMFTGFVCETAIYVRLLHRHASDAVAIVCSLAIYTVIANTLALLFGNETRVMRSGVQVPIVFGQVAVTPLQLAIIGISGVVLAAFFLSLRSTSCGKVIRAVRDSPQLASVYGINYESVRRTVFLLGSLLAGIGAILLAVDTGVDPQAGISLALTAGVAAIIGGVQSLEGAALGAVLLGFLQNLVTWQFGHQWAPAATFGILILFLLLKPEGLLAVAKRVEEK